MASLEQLFVGQGKVYLAARNSAGLTSGYVPVGDADSLAVNTSQTFLDHQESMSGNRSTVLHVPTQTVWNMSLNIQNWSPENIAKAFYGTASAAVAGGSVTGEAIVAYNNTMCPLAKPGVSAVTVTKTAGSVPLVLDTDYTLDAVNGTITILPGSTVVPAGAGVPCTVNYTHTGYTSKVDAAMTTIQEYKIRFEGKNIADGGKAVIVELHRCALDMSKTLPLLSTTVMTLTMDGMLLADETQTAGSQYMTIIKK